jgi:hypothetical protein
MPLKDGVYIIASTLDTNPVLDIEGAANPFNSPISGVVGLSVPLLMSAPSYISTDGFQVRETPITPPTNISSGS